MNLLRFSRPGLFGLLLSVATGILRAAAVDAQGLEGKVLCGYQGWFNTGSDGAGRGWFHWSKGNKPLGPGTAKIDLWPDVSEFPPEERDATGFRFPDGTVAEVFSSYRRGTVLRHFRWMEEAGIDGVFLQRFIVDVQGGEGRRHNDAVLGHVREGAKASGRVFALMYDLSGLGADSIRKVMDDWSAVDTDGALTRDSRYLRHRGRPLVAVWGVGFSDGRKYTIADCARLVDFLHERGCSVMLGVPTYWRERRNDAVEDPALEALLRRVEVVSPWTVGRYRSPEQVRRHGERLLEPDLAWCRSAGVDCLPVVFPGFTWHNMQGGPSDDIPRLKGGFLWSQFVELRRRGVGAAYVAMFDEVDEGTAIFKCRDDVPKDPSATFVGMEGLPSDFYLRLTGEGRRLLRGEVPVTESAPASIRQK